MGGGHARDGIGPRAALSHYDSTSTVIADVAAGEDEHGIWVAGWVRPKATDNDIIELRAAKLSGDWREFPEGMDLLIAHCVNAPGFDVPHASVGIRNGAQVSLVAAGVVAAAPTNLGTAIVTIKPDVELMESVLDELEGRKARREKMRKIAAAAGRDPASRMAALRGGK
jgi:hypothetical protein